MVKEVCDVCGERNKLHFFPKKKEQAEQWADAINWSEEFEKRIKNVDSKSISICTKHFTDASYTDSNRTKLRKGTIPVSYEYSR